MQVLADMGNWFERQYQSAVIGAAGLTDIANAHNPFVENKTTLAAEFATHYEIKNGNTNAANYRNAAIEATKKGKLESETGTIGKVVSAMMLPAEKIAGASKAGADAAKKAFLWTPYIVAGLVGVIGLGVVGYFLNAVKRKG